MNIMHLQVQTNGVTGWIQFDSFGRRTNVSLDIVGLNQDGLYKVDYVKDSSLISQQFLENIGPAMVHLTCSKPVSARLEVEASRSLYTTASEALASFL
jgi:hypothetical protein